MNTTRRISEPTRWIGSAESDALPCATFFLDGRRIGESRLALSAFDVNAHRTCLFGQVPSRFGMISVMVETPNASEDACRLSRENDTAMRCLDAIEYRFENGAVAALDMESGYWTVSMGGEVIATACSRDDAIAVAHKQVAA